MVHSVVAIDDHPFILESIRTYLEKSPNFQLIATAMDGAEGLRLLRDTSPDLAVIDINLPKLDGLEIVRRVRAQGQDVGIVMISGGKAIQDARLSMLAGANGYVGKSEAADLLLAAMTLARRGYLSFPLSSIGQDSAENPVPGILTKREARVLQLLAEGYSIAEIANRLGISPKTVSTFKYRISQKVDLPQ